MNERTNQPTNTPDYNTSGGITIRLRCSKKKVSNKPTNHQFLVRNGQTSNGHMGATSATRHFGTTKLVPKCNHLETSAPTLSRITGGAVSRRNCPGSEVSRLFVDPVPKDLKTLVPMCLVAEVSANRPYTALAHEAP